MTDPEYVLARTALLDVLTVLEAHRDSLILIGAQAVYLHAPGGLAMPLYTTDADLALDAALLATEPDIAQALQSAGYVPGANPGSWTSPSGIHIDLLGGTDVGGGRRSATLPGHDRATARRTPGIEVAIVDNSPMQIASLDPRDPRTIALKVASPSALLIAKLTKIQERTQAGVHDRILPKDAGDILRLLRLTDSRAIGDRLAALRLTSSATDTIERALTWARADLAQTRSTLVELAVTAAQGTEPDTDIEQAMRVLMNDVLERFTDPEHT